MHLNMSTIASLQLIANFHLEMGLLFIFDTITTIVNTQLRVAIKNESIVRTLYRNSIIVVIQVPKDTIFKTQNIKKHIRFNLINYYHSISLLDANTQIYQPMMCHQSTYSNTFSTSSALLRQTRAQPQGYPSESRGIITFSTSQKASNTKRTSEVPAEKLRLWTCTLRELMSNNSFFCFSSRFSFGS